MLISINVSFYVDVCLIYSLLIEIYYKQLISIYVLFNFDSCNVNYVSYSRITNLKV